MATALSESEAKSVVEADRKFHLHSFSVPKDLHLGPKDTFVSADNIYLYYADGTRVIDGLSGLGCVNVGYGRREIADAAHEALIALPYGLTIGRVTHPYAARLAEKVVEKLPSAYSRVFFASSGSEAVESAIKLARYFWHVQDKPKKKKIVSRTRAYHGGTLFTAALSDLPGMHEAFGLPLDNDVERISAPFPYYRDEGESPEAYGVRIAAELEAKIKEVGADNIAAFIGEPLLFGGGCVAPPPRYWQEIRRICNEHDVLLIADEVVCGFGRTGSWFAQQTFDFTADIMSMAKGITSAYMPLGATAISGRVDEAFQEGDFFMHGFTQCGHPAGCNAALKNIEILESEGIVEQVGTETGPHLNARLKELESHPLVGEGRSVGMIGAVELVRDKARREPFPTGSPVITAAGDNCVSRGLYTRGGGSCIEVSPPLVTTVAQLDEIIRILTEALDATYKQLDELESKQESAPS